MSQAGVGHMRTGRIAAGFFLVMVALALVPQAAAGEGDHSSDRRIVLGTLTGDERLGDDCAWLVDADGDAWQVLWPAGYHLQFPSPRVPVLTGPDGDVVARAGDRVRVIGVVPAGIGSRCMVGRLFEASRAALVSDGRESTPMCFPTAAWPRPVWDVIQRQRPGIEGTARYNWWSWRWPDGRGCRFGAA